MRRTFNRTPRKQSITCQCGKDAKLIKRRNFSFGRNAKGRVYLLYKCKECFKEVPLIKTQEVRK